jgi:hypothetical protein
MSKFLLAVILTATMVSGCANRITGLTMDADGALVNRSGQALHDVRLWGKMYSHGNFFWLDTCHVGDFDAGESRHGVLRYRFDAIDSLQIEGRAREGRFSFQWP